MCDVVRVASYGKATPSIFFFFCLYVSHRGSSPLAVRPFSRERKICVALHGLVFWDSAALVSGEAYWRRVLS